MLERELEPELIDTADEARQYDAIDHSAVNRLFVQDLLAVCPAPHDVLDVGTGTALIPIELCRRAATCRVMAADRSRAMLDLARYRIEVAGLISRIKLDCCDAKQMHYRDGMFDVVLCNGTLHHFADPLAVLRESWRVTGRGGRLFFRDLLRPGDHQALEQLIATFVGDGSELQQQMYRQSLQAALNLDEIRDLVTTLGADPHTAQITSDRHWTWTLKKE